MSEIVVTLDGEKLEAGEFAVFVKEDGKFPDVLKNHPPLYEVAPGAVKALQTLGVDLRPVPSGYIVHSVIQAAQERLK